MQESSFTDMSGVCTFPDMTESVRLECGISWSHIIIIQFYMQFCTQLTIAYVAEASCNQLLMDTAYITAHNQYALLY